VFGAIIGDIVGSPFEKHNFLGKNFELFSRFSRFTDDTVLTVATAYAIKHDGNYAEAYREFYHRYPRRGFGPGFRQWAAGKIAMPTSQGNGAAMRVSPIGWAFDSLETTLEEAKKSAVVSHNSEQAIIGAQSVAEAIYLARHGSSKKDIRTKIEQKYGYSFTLSIDQLRGKVRGCTCQETVPAAFQAFFEATEFQDCIQNAVSIGGDSDTIAAIAGSLAEAHHEIPEEIRQQAMERLDDYLLDICKHINNDCALLFTGDYHEQTH